MGRGTTIKLPRYFQNHFHFQKSKWILGNSLGIGFQKTAAHIPKQFFSGGRDHNNIRTHIDCVRSEIAVRWSLANVYESPLH